MSPSEEGVYMKKVVV